MIEGSTQAAHAAAPDAGIRDPVDDAYRQYGDAVFGLARRVAGDAAIAEDVTQEVFLRFWSQPQRFDPTRGTLRSYLLAQSHGRAVDRVRSEIARKRREERCAARRARAVDRLAAQACTRVAAEKVRRCVAALPVPERRAIVLAYFEGHTYHEVAGMLEIPEGTAKSRIRAALGKLRALLAAQGIDGRWLG